jgi:hypothetical protein
MKARLARRGHPRADTKITVGFGLQTAETESGIVNCVTQFAEGLWRVNQELPVRRTMPGKRVLPVVAAEVCGDYAEGLGRYLTGFLSPPGERGAV